MKRQLVFTCAFGLVAGLGLSATAQTTTTLSPIQEIRLVVNFPLPPANVAGFTVDVICKDLIGLPAGAPWTQSFSFTAAGGSAKALYPLGPSTNCVFRLTVLGTGSRSIFGTGFIIGGAVRAVTFPTTVNGQAVDPQSVGESEAVAVTRETDALFGLPVVTATVATTTTTSSPTTTSPPTTTRPPTTIAPPTTASPTTTPAPTTSTTQPPPPPLPANTTTVALAKPTVAKTAKSKPAARFRTVRRCRTVKNKRVCKTVRERVIR